MVCVYWGGGAGGGRNNETTLWSLAIVQMLWWLLQSYRQVSLLCLSPVRCDVTSHAWKLEVYSLYVVLALKWPLPLREIPKFGGSPFTTLHCCPNSLPLLCTDMVTLCSVLYSISLVVLLILVCVYFFVLYHNFVNGRKMLQKFTHSSRNHDKRYPNHDIFCDHFVDYL